MMWTSWATFQSKASACDSCGKHRAPSQLRGCDERKSAVNTQVHGDDGEGAWGAWLICLWVINHLLLTGAGGLCSYDVIRQISHQISQTIVETSETTNSGIQVCILQWYDKWRETLEINTNIDFCLWCGWVSMRVHMFLNILSDTAKNAVQINFFSALIISLSTILPAFVPNGVVGVCSVSGSPVHHTHTIHSHTLSPFRVSYWPRHARLWHVWGNWRKPAHSQNSTQKRSNLGSTVFTLTEQSMAL